MKSKQEVIQEAYGQYWPEVEKDIVQECYICLINEHSTLVAWNDLLMIAHKTDNHLYMPAQLKGIETNNGWTIADVTKLPKEGIYNVGYFLDDGTFHLGNDEVEWYELREYVVDFGFTHYQPIIKPQAPIY